MTYDTPQALRMALEQRLLSRSQDTGISLDRLRRRVAFERTVTRLQTAEPGQWVLKGGMALEVRLRDEARHTKDIDVGLRDDVTDTGMLRERLVEALGSDPKSDGFVFAVGPVRALREDGDGREIWRVKVDAELAGRLFVRLQVDVSSHAHELDATEFVVLPSSLDFAGIAASQIEIIDIHRHAAEKFHGMLKDFGDRENTRVRDLVDLVILSEHDLLKNPALATAVRQVWNERDGVDPPSSLPPLPSSWRERYRQLAAEHDLETLAFPAAAARVDALWAEISPTFGD